MRGKHAKAAANRRDREELERRAVIAEQRAERFKKELAELREKSDRQIAGLRADLAQALKDRDAGTAPALAQAEEKIRALMAERDEAQAGYKRIHDRWDAFTLNIGDVLRGMGLTSVEAMEAMMAAVTPDGTARTVYEGPRMDTTGQQIAVDRARGKRNSVDPLADRRPLATDEPAGASR